MMLYDLFLHRRPFVFFFALYAVLIIVLSVGLQRLVSYFNARLVFSHSNPEEVGRCEQAKGQQGDG